MPELSALDNLQKEKQTEFESRMIFFLPISKPRRNKRGKAANRSSDYDFR